MNHAKKTIALHALAMAALAVKAGSAVIRNDAELAAIQNLKSRLGELSETSRAIQAKADAEKRDLNADEQKELDACLEEFDQVEADIGRRERIVAQAGRLATPTARVTQPDPVVVTDPVQQPTNNARPSSGVGRDGLRNTRVSTLEERQRWGFTNMGDFAIAVRGAVLNPSNIDGRLTNAAASTYGSEAVGADGGFAVPPEWRAEIMKQVDAEDGFLSMTDVQTITGNSITYPVDESPAWASSGGIRAYWDGEASTMTQSKPVLKDLTVKTHRLTALVPITEELQSDASAMSSYITGQTIHVDGGTQASSGWSHHPDTGEYVLGATKI